MSALFVPYTQLFSVGDWSFSVAIHMSRTVCLCITSSIFIDL